jgi:hypothetical protein
LNNRVISTNFLSTSWRTNPSASFLGALSFQEAHLFLSSSNQALHAFRAIVTSGCLVESKFLECLSTVLRLLIRLGIVALLLVSPRYSIYISMDAALGKVLYRGLSSN